MRPGYQYPSELLCRIGGASKAGVLVKGSNYLETLSQTKIVVFDKTGTLTQGVFEVNGIHHSQMEDEKLIEYAALAEVLPPTLSVRVFRRLTEKKLTGHG